MAEEEEAREGRRRRRSKYEAASNREYDIYRVGVKSQCKQHMWISGIGLNHFDLNHKITPLLRPSKRLMALILG